jgi:hypothetical protein
MASDTREGVIRVVTISTSKQGYYMLGFFRGMQDTPKVLVGTMSAYLLTGGQSSFSTGYATAADIRWLDL